MKLKIKDLTVEQLFKECDKHEYIDDCKYKCPLRKFCKMCLSSGFDYEHIFDEVEIR